MLDPVVEGDPLRGGTDGTGSLGLGPRISSFD